MYNGQALCLHSLVPFLNLLDRFQFWKLMLQIIKQTLFGFVFVKYNLWEPGCLVCVMLRLWVGWSRVWILVGQEIFVPSKTSRWPLIYLVPFFFSGLMGPEHEVNHWPPSFAKFWMSIAIPLFRIYAFVVWTGTALPFTLSSVTCTCLGVPASISFGTFFFFSLSGVKGLEHEVNHSPPSFASFEWAELYLCSGYMPSWCGQGQLYHLPWAV